DVMDEDGTVVLVVRGLRMGNRAGERSDRERVLAERLLAVNWQQQALPELPDTDAGDWLLLASDPDDELTSRLTDVLKTHGAQSERVQWPHGAGFVAARLRDGGVRGLVVIFPAPLGDPDVDSLTRAREHVRQLVRIARELPDLSGEPPRLYAVTRCAQAVLPTDLLNLEHAGLRGLLRVIGAEHPQLRPSQIDVDDSCDPE